MSTAEQPPLVDHLIERTHKRLHAVLQPLGFQVELDSTQPPYRRVDVAPPHRHDYHHGIGMSQDREGFKLWLETTSCDCTDYATPGVYIYTFQHPPFDASGRGRLIDLADPQSIPQLDQIVELIIHQLTQLYLQPEPCP